MCLNITPIFLIKKRRKKKEKGKLNHLPCPYIYIYTTSYHPTPLLPFTAKLLGNVVYSLSPLLPPHPPSPTPVRLSSPQSHRTGSFFPKPWTTLSLSYSFSQQHLMWLSTRSPKLFLHQVPELIPSPAFPSATPDPPSHSREGSSPSTNLWMFAYSLGSVFRPLPLPI